MQTTGVITDINIDYKTQKSKISLLLDTKELDVIEQLKNQDKLNVELKKWYKKRSLDANSYCWVLCDMIAKEISKDGEIVTKEVIYKDAIKNIGVFEPFIVQEITFDNFKRIWEKQGLGFLVHEVSRKDKAIKVHCYLVTEAKALNLETKPQEEINSLLAQWH